MIGLSRPTRRRQRRLRAQADNERNGAWADRYLELTGRLDGARRAVTHDLRHPRSWPEQRGAHHLLASLLGEAVTYAFAADAAGAVPAEGKPSWTAEGLARSTERESAILAAIDLGWHPSRPLSGTPR